jgi:hypothetical protein
MRHAGNVCAPDFVAISLSGPTRRARPGQPTAIIEPSSPGLWVLYPTAHIERIYQNKKVEKLQKWPSESENNCELVSAKKKKLLKIIIRKAGREWECHYGNFKEIGAHSCTDGKPSMNEISRK